MTVERRGFGKAPSPESLIIAGKNFTDAAMTIDINHLLDVSAHQRQIGRRAAELSGVMLQREGDSLSERLVYSAYDTFYDLMQPVLASRGPNDTKEIFSAPTTRQTLHTLINDVSSYGVSVITHKYRVGEDYLHLSDDGLKLNDNCPIPKKFESKRGGCPYARSERTPYFNRFSDRIVDTYIEAHNRNMPHGWLEATSRLLTIW